MVTYKESGVDIDAANQAVQRIKKLTKSTFTNNVVTETKRQMENDVVFSVDQGKWVDKDESNKNFYTPAQISSFILSGETTISGINSFLSPT